MSNPQLWKTAPQIINQEDFIRKFSKFRHSNQTNYIIILFPRPSVEQRERKKKEEEEEEEEGNRRRYN
jgi:hypothetical protein